VSYDRQLLLGPKRNEILGLREVLQYGEDSFGDPDYVSIYGLRPRDWYARGVRILGRTAVECTRDRLADLIGRDVAEIERTALGTGAPVVVDPFAGSANTLYWIQRHLRASRAVGFELDAAVFEASRRNLSILSLELELLHVDYEAGLKAQSVYGDALLIVFVAPPWGDALSEASGLDLRRTTPPVATIVDLIEATFPRQPLLLAIQIYETVDHTSLEEVTARFDWSAVKTYEIDAPGKNLGLLLAAIRWRPAAAATRLELGAGRQPPDVGGVEGEGVLVEAAEAYRVALGERLLAAYALGSLAHGGFSALVSDIDLGLFVSDPLEPEDAERIQAVADAERAKGGPLCERLSVFWGTPGTLRGECEGGRFPPLDRLDLLENGRLLFGTDARAGLPSPTTRELVVSGGEFALDFLAGVRASAARQASGLGSLRPARDGAVAEIRNPTLLVSRGVRRLTKLVLFPVRFLFTAATGSVGTNEDAVSWYLANEAAPGRPLVRAALARRTAPPPDATAVELLRDHLVPLYLYFIDDHISRLDALGEVELARAFGEWRRRLEMSEADIVLDAFSSGRLIGLFSDGDPSLDENRAYAIASEVHERCVGRGEKPVGRKIGFTNRAIWTQRGLSAPIWGYMYDSTVHYAGASPARVDIGHLIQPRIEPEIQLHFARTPPVTRDETAILECIDWIAHGFEIVQCPFTDWKFRVVDAIAAYAVHGLLVIGPPVAVAEIEDCAAKLRSFTITLLRNGEQQATGGGKEVLDSPLLAFAHLAEVLTCQSRFPPVQAGEVVTTGTLTDLFPATAGENWSTTLEGIDLPGMSVTLA
jgi:2-keto-4-pentenoate hydratase